MNYSHSVSVSIRRYVNIGHCRKDSATFYVVATQTHIPIFPIHFVAALDQPPDVKFIKKESGGIGFQETVKQTKGVNAEVARLICKEYKISCAEIILREDITVDQVWTTCLLRRYLLP